MGWLYILSVFVHILCSIIWIGGMIFLSLVLVPTLRKTEDRKQAIQLILSTGKRFKIIGWHALLLLLITGLLNTYFRGGFIEGTAFWHSTMGRILMWKMTLFILVLILAGLHDFWLGPRATRIMTDEPNSAAALRARKTASWIGRANLILGLAIVFLAILMIRGIPA